MRKDSFQAMFMERLDEIESRAKKVGLTMTDLCRRSGVARATPDRWRSRPPKSVELVDDLEDVVLAAEQEEAQRETERA